jgi:hypothetical protein
VRYPSVRFMEELAGIVLSLAFAFATVIFQLLDGRNRQLIHYAEDALRVIESNSKSPVAEFSRNVSDCNELKPNYLKVFVREECDKCKGEIIVSYGFS